MALEMKWKIGIKYGGESYDGKSCGPEEVGVADTGTQQLYTNFGWFGRIHLYVFHPHIVYSASPPYSTCVPIPKIRTGSSFSTQPYIGEIKHSDIMAIKERKKKNTFARNNLWCCGHGCCSCNK